MSKKITKRRGREEWMAIIAGQEAGGKTVSAYCRDRNLSEKSFYGWRKRLGVNGKPKREGFILVNPAQGDAPKMLQIHTPGGYRLEAARGLDGETLRTVLKALAAI